MIPYITKTVTRALLLVVPFFLFAQSGSISGNIADSNGSPLAGANVMIDGTTMGGSSDADGNYSIDGVPSGSYTLTASFIGYASSSVSVSVGTGVTNTDFSLAVSNLPGEEVVVSASRRVEKLVDAPATISVIGEAKIRKSTGFNFGSLMKEVKGADTYQVGISGTAINARGFFTAYSYRFIQMGDGMNAMLPGAGLASGAMWPVAKEDLSRMEVILGPSSALYGPNAHNGLVNVISKHPKQSQGGTVVLGAGQQGILSQRFRYAGEMGSLSYKVNAEHISGDDWEQENNTYWVDVNGNGAVDADSGETVAVGGEDDSKIDNLRYNASIYYDLGNSMELAGGYGKGIQNGWGTTNVGVNRIDNWTLSHFWGQFSHPRVFARVYQTTNSAGTTHPVTGRAAQEIGGATREDAIDAVAYIDDSKKLSAELQGNVEVGPAIVIAGFDYSKFEPVSGRTYLDDNGTDPISGTDEGEAIVLSQKGAYAQAQMELPAALALTAAFRWDDHDNYGSNSSPRLGLVWKGLGFGNLRATWNRAFQAPAILQQLLYLPYGAVGPYNLILRGAGLGFTYEDGSKIDPLIVETNETLEFGFKGTPVKGLYVDANYYMSTYENFIGPLHFISDPLGLGLAGEAGTPLIVTHYGDQEIDPQYIMTYSNFGEVSISGFDLGVKYMVNKNISVFANYSKVDFSELTNKREDETTAAEYAGLWANTPDTKWAAGVDLANLGLDGLFLSFTARNTASFDFVSGSHRATEAGKGTSVTGQPYFTDNGPLGGVTLLDLAISYELNSSMSVNVTIDNITDVEARMMAGAPVSRRLAVAEVRYAF